MDVNEIIEKIQSMAQSDDAPNELGIFASLMSLPDDEFKLITSLMEDDLLKQLKNPDIIYGLIADMKKNNEDVYNLEEYRSKLVEELNKIDEISQIKKDYIMNIYDSLINEMNNALYKSDLTVTIPIELLSDDIKIPTYANPGDAGMDIYSPADYTINPGETVLIKCGFKVAIPAGYELQVRPKSGMSLKTKLRVANAPGTIDSGYRDEVGVIIENVDAPIHDAGLISTAHMSTDMVAPITNPEIVNEYGTPYYIEKGQKFAQLVLQKVPTARFQLVESIDSVAGNRGGGFGSSGKF